MHRTCRSGHGHRNPHLVAVDFSTVHQPQVHDVDPDFGVVNALQGGHDVIFGHHACPPRHTAASGRGAAADSHAPHLRPLLQVVPDKLAAVLGLELIIQRLGVVVVD